MNNQSVYFISGEVSGDTHGAELIHALQDISPGLFCYGTGGPLMQKASPLINDWLEQAAVMGIWEVLKHYPWFKKKFYEILTEIVNLSPDALVLIDYPGFNLRMANAIREALPKIKIIYYISPQVWAWNKKRIPQMAKVLDKMLCILPFEKLIFEKNGLATKFVGHPIIDELQPQRIKTSRQQNLIGLFPGSRVREVRSLLPTMLATAKSLLQEHPHLHFHIPAASKNLLTPIEEEINKSKLSPSQYTLTLGGSHHLMQTAQCGILASGTATLEAAYFQLPYCLIYKTSWSTYLIAKMLVKIQFIGLVNILAEKEIVPEFIQGAVSSLNLTAATLKFINDPIYVSKMQHELSLTIQKLGGGGCHVKAAKEIMLTL